MEPLQNRRSESRRNVALSMDVWLWLKDSWLLDGVAI